jgi:hypothetical protein
MSLNRNEITKGGPKKTQKTLSTCTNMKKNIMSLYKNETTKGGPKKIKKT